MPLMRLLGISLLSFLLTACGGGGSLEKDGSISDGDSTTETSTYTISLKGYLKASDTESNSVTADAPLELRASLVNEDGDAVSGERITFTLADSIGELDPVAGTALTQSDGVATIELIAGSSAGAGEVTATFTAIIKVAGISLLAISGLIISGLPTITGNYVASNSQALPEGFGFVAALALSILAFKGFTTITNQGGDIKNPHKNVGRSIIISIAVCTIIYVVLALSVAGGLSVEEIIIAKDYALAAAAKPLFGEWGSILTILLAIVATVSGVIASIYSASRMLGMLGNMKQVPDMNKMKKLKNPSLIFTVSLAILLTILFDLTRIASIGAIFYLIMDIAIHWGLFRYLKKEVKFNPIIPIIAIVMDIVILSAFIYLKYVNDPFVLVVAGIGIALVFLFQFLFMKSHTDKDGNMKMGMEMDEEEMMKM